MKRIFWILVLCLAVTGRAFSQEETDEFFEDEDAPAESDIEFQPPQQVPPPNPEESNGGDNNVNQGNFGPRRENRFSRPPNFPSGNFSGSQPVGMNSDGSFEFKLVDPPEFKKKKPPLVVPPGIRSKVENNLKSSEKNK